MYARTRGFGGWPPRKGGTGGLPPVKNKQRSLFLGPYVSRFNKNMLQKVGPSTCQWLKLLVLNGIWKSILYLVGSNRFIKANNIIDF